MDSIFSASWCKASDQGDPARYVRNNIGVRARGGVESLKGMRYLSRRTDSTQESAPIACQCLQCADRQPPTRNRGRTPSRGLFPGPFSLASRVAGAFGSRRKGSLTFATPPLSTRLGRRRGGGRQRLRLQPRHHGRGATTVSRGGGRDPALTGPAKDF